MDGKLIKLEESKYTLVYKEGNIAWEHDPAFDGKLSLKNCEAIENGYDLDELAEEYAEENAKDDNISYHNLYTPLEYAYRYGFQKALEILGDKKFSESDLINAYNTGRNYQRNAEMDYHITPYLKSLQQTEWDVIVEMEKEVGTKLYDDGREFFMIDGTKPKLDKDGCLILKRK